MLYEQNRKDHFGKSKTPTLIFALIHVATMVIACIFMIARCSPLFEYPPKCFGCYVLKS
jgi:NADH:ubiquinone oxidoreductase subunit 5 (subunit L)/multisubunit Na+/H+ antiporter MnhA subunit